MNTKFLVSLFTFTTVIVLFHVAATVKAFTFPGDQVENSSETQEQAEAPPKVSANEAKALTAINGAPDAGAKLTAAEEFVKKYPKSVALPQLARQVAIEISKVKDSNQKLAFADRFQQAFSDDKALGIVNSARLDAFVAANRTDEAFNLAATLLTRDPEDLHTLMQMSFSGTDAAKHGNGKYVQQSQQYGSKAIE